MYVGKVLGKNSILHTYPIVQAFCQNVIKYLFSFSSMTNYPINQLDYDHKWAI